MIFTASETGRPSFATEPLAKTPSNLIQANYEQLPRMSRKTG